MRTNIELNDDLVKEARKYSLARTKRALIEEALLTYVEVKTDARAWQADMLKGRVRFIVPKRLRRSITYDNGFENREYYKLNRTVDMKSHFCFPYCSG